MEDENLVNVHILWHKYYSTSLIRKKIILRSYDRPGPIVFLVFSSSEHSGTILFWSLLAMYQSRYLKYNVVLCTIIHRFFHSFFIFLKKIGIWLMRRSFIFHQKPSITYVSLIRKKYDTVPECLLLYTMNECSPLAEN